MEKPQINLTPDFTKLIEAVKDYMDFLEDEDACEDNISDGENPIFEAAVMVVYGDNAFDYINKKIDELD